MGPSGTGLDGGVDGGGRFCGEDGEEDVEPEEGADAVVGDQVDSLGEGLVWFGGHCGGGAGLHCWLVGGGDVEGLLLAEEVWELLKLLHSVPTLLIRQLPPSLLGSQFSCGLLYLHLEECQIRIATCKLCID